VISIIASKSNKFENVFNCFGRHTWEETKFDVPIVCLQYESTQVAENEERNKTFFIWKILERSHVRNKNGRYKIEDIVQSTAKRRFITFLSEMFAGIGKKSAS